MPFDNLHKHTLCSLKQQCFLLILACMRSKKDLWYHRLYILSKMTYVIHPYIHVTNTSLDLSWVWMKLLAWSYFPKHKFLLSIIVPNKGFMVIRRCSAPFGKHQPCNNNGITIKMYITSDRWRSFCYIMPQQLWSKMLMPQHFKVCLMVTTQIPPHIILSMVCSTCDCSKCVFTTMCLIPLWPNILLLANISLTIRLSFQPVCFTAQHFR